MAKTRRALIEHRVLAAGSIDFGSLADEFGVSEMTIRRDIDALASKGVVRKVLGGAIAVPRGAAAAGDAEDDPALTAAVLDQLRPGASVLLMAGPLTAPIAALAVRRSLGLRVVTADVASALMLTEDPRAEVHVTGGRLAGRTQTLTGGDVLRSIEDLNCETVILGGVSADADRGITAADESWALTLRTALRAAASRLAVVPRRDVDGAAFSRVCDLSSIDVLVTDAGPGSPTVIAAARHGRVVTAGAAPDGESQ